MQDAKTIAAHITNRDEYYRVVRNINEYRAKEEHYKFLWNEWKNVVQLHKYAPSQSTAYHEFNFSNEAMQKLLADQKDIGAKLFEHQQGLAIFEKSHPMKAMLFKKMGYPK